MMMPPRRHIERLVHRILEGDGAASRADRRAAFDHDLQAAFAPGASEDQMFEKAICAAVGQSVRVYDRALAALEKA
jgi:hypothetical protein